jgi:hypothetical protein
MAAGWSAEEKQQCVDETPATFKYGGSLLTYIAGPRCGVVFAPLVGSVVRAWSWVVLVWCGVVWCGTRVGEAHTYTNPHYTGRRVGLVCCVCRTLPAVWQSAWRRVSACVCVEFLTHLTHPHNHPRNHWLIPLTPQGTLTGLRVLGAEALGRRAGRVHTQEETRNTIAAEARGGDRSPAPFPRDLNGRAWGCGAAASRD